MKDKIKGIKPILRWHILGFFAASVLYGMLSVLFYDIQQFAWAVGNALMAYLFLLTTFGLQVFRNIRQRLNHIRIETSEITENKDTIKVGSTGMIHRWHLWLGSLFFVASVIAASISHVSYENKTLFLIFTTIAYTTIFGTWAASEFRNIQQILVAIEKSIRDGKPGDEERKSGEEAPSTAGGCRSS